MTNPSIPHWQFSGADPYDIKPGDYEVVLAPECVASIAIFLGEYGFNGKQVEEGPSRRE